MFLDSSEGFAVKLSISKSCLKMSAASEQNVGVNVADVGNTEMVITEVIGSSLSAR